MNYFKWPEEKVTNVRVVDGDTLAITLETKVKVRLSRIQCPERNSDKGKQATKYVQEKITKAKDLKIIAHDTGNFGRYLADVFIDGTNLNKELIEKGLATLYDSKSKAKNKAQSKKNK